MGTLLDEHRLILHNEHVEFMKLQQENERKIKEYKNSIDTFKKYLMNASVKHYSVWLKGYLENGGKVTHHYDRNVSGIYIAIGSFKLPELYGACSFDIIVPSNIDVTYDDLGHNNLYFMKDFSNVGLIIPCYNDVAEYLDRVM